MTAQDPPGGGWLFAAATSHLTHACIIQVTDVNNVFAPDGSLNSERRHRQRGHRRPDTPPPHRRRTPLSAREDLSLTRVLPNRTNMPPGHGYVPTRSGRSTRYPPHAPSTTLSYQPIRPIIIQSRLQIPQDSGLSRAVPTPAAVAPLPTPSPLDSLTGPRPVPLYQPLNLSPNALQSSAACYELITSQAEAGISRRTTDEPLCPGSSVPQISSRSSLPDPLPEWLTEEQRHAISVLWDERSNGVSSVGCRFCEGQCNAGRDICNFCILVLAGDRAL